MARDEKPSDKGRVKVRVIEFEMEGSNQTLRESIRDIVGAIGRSQIQRPAQLAAPSRDGAAARAAPTDSDEVVDAEIAQGDGADFPEETDSGGGSRRQRFLRTPKVLDDLDLVTGPMSLKEFLEKLNPTSDINRYAAIAYWLKEVRNVEEVTADHIHTGYKTMKWATPADASARLRQMKGTAYGYVSKGTKPGAYKFNHVGDGHVEGLMKTAGVEL